MSDPSRSIHSAQSSSQSPHPSLPARPPPPAAGFTSFKPRTVTGSSSWHTSSPAFSAGPTMAPGYQPNPTTPGYYTQPYAQSYGRGADGFGPGPQAHGGFPSASYDPEMEAQIAQWQSAYASRDDAPAGGKSAPGPGVAGGANALPLGQRPNASTPLTNSELAAAANPESGVAAVVAGSDGKQRTVVRSGGGQTWQDQTLLEWDPAHFRIFVGNLAGEVTDDSLLKAFARFNSVQKARVIRDKRTTKSKGYGFVSFSDGDEYFRAARDMQGKYIGSHPVIIKKSTTEIKASNPSDKRKSNAKGGRGGGHGAPGGGANTGAGVQRKPVKTKGGFKVLG